MAKEKPVEVTLHTPSIYVTIEGKRYTVSFSDEGIFIASNDGVKVTKQSATENWLFVK